VPPSAGAVALVLADVTFTVKQYVQTIITLAELLIGGSLT
jgi:hypothetical protein